MAANLRDLGVTASPEDVVTSAQAAARLLRDEHGAGAPIAVLGAEGLAWAIREAGLEPVLVGDPRAVAIVSGYAPEMRWKVIMRAATLIRNGLPWVATNTDLTLPTDDGLAPGHGLLVRLISDFAEVTPQVAGKPERPLLDETRLRVEGDHPLMVGDRLDTDIEGAHRAGTDSMLVMTGVSSLADLARARPHERPTWIGHDLTALSRPGVAAQSEDGPVPGRSRGRPREEESRPRRRGDGRGSRRPRRVVDGRGSGCLEPPRSHRSGGRHGRPDPARFAVDLGVAFAP